MESDDGTGGAGKTGTTQSSEALREPSIVFVDNGGSKKT